HDTQQLLVRVGDKSFEIAAAVAWRNPSFVEQPRGEPLAPAVTSFDSATAVDVHRLPSSAVANRASHRMSSLRKRGSSTAECVNDVIVGDCRSVDRVAASV